MAECSRVLLLDLSARFGGASARVLGLLEHFSPERIALAGLHDAPVIRMAASKRLEHYIVGTHRADPAIVMRIVKLIRSEGFQLVDTQNPQSKLWGSLAACLTGIGLVSTLNSWYESEHEGRLKGRLYHLLECATAGTTDLFIAVSRDIHRRLLYEGVSDHRIMLIPNAVPLPEKSSEPDKRRIRNAFMIPDRALLCCAVGRLVEAKGHKNLIQALGLLQDLDFYCLILGDGHLRGDLQAEITRLGLAQRIRLPGFVEPAEIHEILRACDLFIMPSLSEGTPIALLEAAALGLPIIAGRVGGIPDLLVDGKHALLIDPGDRHKLAAAIRRVSEQPLRAMDLAREAQRHVRESYSMAAQIEATRLAYRKALAFSRHKP